MNSNNIHYYMKFEIYSNGQEILTYGIAPIARQYYGGPGVSDEEILKRIQNSVKIRPFLDSNCLFYDFD